MTPTQHFPWWFNLDDLVHPMIKVRTLFFVMTILKWLNPLPQAFDQWFWLVTPSTAPSLSELGHVFIHGSQSTFCCWPKPGTLCVLLFDLLSPLACAVPQSEATPRSSSPLALHLLVFSSKDPMQKHLHELCPLCSCRKWFCQQICRVVMCVHMGCPPFIMCHSLSHKVVSNALWFLLQSGVWDGCVS